MYKRPVIKAKPYKGKPGPLPATSPGRDYVLQVPLNDSERTYIEAAAQQMSISMSEFVRRCIFRHNNGANPL